MIDYLIHELVKERFEFHGNAIVVILTSLIGVILKITLPLIHLVENWIFYSKKEYHPLCGCGERSYTFAQKINLPMNEQKQVRQPLANSHMGRFC